MKLYLNLAFLLVNFVLCTLQIPVFGQTITFEKTFGGPGDDYAICIENASDGYVIFGNTKSYGAGSTDLFLLKTDNNIFKIWATILGGSKKKSGNGVVTSTDRNFFLNAKTEWFRTG